MGFMVFRVSLSGLPKGKEEKRQGKVQLPSWIQLFAVESKGTGVRNTPSGEPEEDLSVPQFYRFRG